MHFATLLKLLFFPLLSIPNPFFSPKEKVRVVLFTRDEKGDRLSVSTISCPSASVQWESNSHPKRSISHPDRPEAKRQPCLKASHLSPAHHFNHLGIISELIKRLLTIYQLSKQVFIISVYIFVLLSHLKHFF